MGIMEKKMDNYYSILRLYRDNGTENGNYYSTFWLYRGNSKDKTTVVYWGYI